MSKLKKLRLLSNMSQHQLSVLLQISQSYLSLLEREKRDITPELNKKIEEVFGYSIKFID
ncbi:helix-turn-helix domain-containing protein [Neobacillus cucumis]|nr:helix-turn-helix transcriptional regulator [Neobacillus cucumis]